MTQALKMTPDWFAPWFSVKEIVAPVLAATACRFPCSDLFTWQSSVLAGSRVAWAHSSINSLVALKIHSGGRMVLCAKIRFHGYHLAENGERRGRIKIFSVSLAGVAARYAGLSDGEGLITWSLQALEVASICFVVVLNLQCMSDLVLAAVLQNS